MNLPDIQNALTAYLTGPGASPEATQIMQRLALSAGYRLDIAQDGRATLHSTTTISLDPGDDAAVVVRHPDGGVTEVLVKWDNTDQLYLFVDPSASNTVSVEAKPDQTLAVFQPAP